MGSSSSESGRLAAARLLAAALAAPALVAGNVDEAAEAALLPAAGSAEGFAEGFAALAGRLPSGGRFARAPSTGAARAELKTLGLAPAGRSSSQPRAKRAPARTAAPPARPQTMSEL